MPTRAVSRFWAQPSCSPPTFFVCFPFPSFAFITFAATLFEQNTAARHSVDRLDCGFAALGLIDECLVSCSYRAPFMSRKVLWELQERKRIGESITMVLVG